LFQKYVLAAATPSSQPCRPRHRRATAIAIYPINLAVEVLGDRWSIIVLRDIMFGNRRSYREILLNSEEGIATNILAARLKNLESAGLIEVLTILCTSRERGSA